MGFANFLYHYVLTDVFTFLLIVLGLFIFFSLLYKRILCDKYEIAIFYVAYFGVVFSFATCIFMNYKGIVSSYYYSNFLLTEALFYLSLLFSQNIFNTRKEYKYRLNKQIKAYEKHDYNFFALIFFTIWISLIIFKVLVLGVRSFEKKGGGSGLIIRLLWIIEPLLQYTIVYQFFKTKTKKNKRKALFSAICYIGASFLSGSKSTVINFFLVLPTFYFLNPDCLSVKEFLRKYGLLLFIIGVVSGIIIIILLTSQSIYLSIMSLLYRFIAFGDAYTYAYPEDVANLIAKNMDVSFIQFLTYDVFSTFRLTSRSYSDAVNIPGMLVEYVAGKGISEGPNTRFNVLGIMCFGYFGNLIFSVFCGTLLAIMHNVFIKGVRKSYIVQLTIFFIFSVVVNLEQDVVLISQLLTKMVMYIPLMFFIIGLEYSIRGFPSRNRI